jgi:ABC-type Zn uptake system ZnuABC Zn-binding protein ZnuA
VRWLAGICAALLVLVLLLLWSAGRREATPANPPQFTVAATVFPLADWLRAVGGPHVNVHLLVSAQSDPHHFEPTVNDALQLTRARAVFAVGLELDPWAKRLADNAGRGDGLAFFTTGDWVAPRAFGLRERE